MKCQMSVEEFQKQSSLTQYFVIYTILRSAAGVNIQTDKPNSQVSEKELEGDSENAQC